IRVDPRHYLLTETVVDRVILVHDFLVEEVVFDLEPEPKDDVQEQEEDERVEGEQGTRLVKRNELGQAGRRRFWVSHRGHDGFISLQKLRFPGSSPAVHCKNEWKLGNDPSSSAR